MSVARCTHPSDLSDAEWSIPAPLLPPPASRGRLRKWPERVIPDAVFYMLMSFQKQSLGADVTDGHLLTAFGQRLASLRSAGYLRLVSPANRR